MLPFIALPAPCLAYPRVTEILSRTMRPSKRKAIKRWREMVGEQYAHDYTECAKARGTKFHNAIEYYFSGLTDTIPQEILNFLEAEGITVLAVERHVFCQTYLYKGKLDILYRREETGAIGVLDWKTGRKPRANAWFADARAQVSAYAHAIGVMYDLHITEAMVVVAYQDFGDAPVNPFRVRPYKWAFQKNTLNERDLQRAFNRFKKRVGEFHNPPTSVGTALGKTSNPFAPLKMQA